MIIEISFPGHEIIFFYLNNNGGGALGCIFSALIFLINLYIYHLFIWVIRGEKKTVMRVCQIDGF